MKALSMMIEKENGNIDTNLFGSVWKVMKQNDGIRYEHTSLLHQQDGLPLQKEEEKLPAKETAL